MSSAPSEDALRLIRRVNLLVGAAEQIAVDRAIYALALRMIRDGSVAPAAAPAFAGRALSRFGERDRVKRGLAV